MTAVPVISSGSFPLRPPGPARTGVSTACGTFGELLQGALPESGEDFLVTLPIARWSRATFRGRPGTSRLTVCPPHKRKALLLTEMILADMLSAGHRMGGVLTIESTLPEGKGLASSSADLVATARAVGNAMGVTLQAHRIESYLARIEPTDGVLYPGIVAYHHRRAKLHSILGFLPPLVVVGFDEGGVVDTVEFNRVPKPYTEADRQEYATLLARLAAAVASGDLREVGAVATISARRNQVLRPKRLLDVTIDISQSAGGLGVATGHSGTCVGVLLDAAHPAFPHRVAEVARACAELAGNVAVYRVLGTAGIAPGLTAGGLSPC
jgi:uncharacterized protein involved in propanediol utilization